MALLKHLKNEKSAQAETSAMQYPASQPDPTSIIPGHLIHTIIRPALLLILLLFSSFSALALAYGCKVDGIYYDITPANRTASVTRVSYSGGVIIPETIAFDGTTYSVTSIGDGAFKDCSGLTKLVSLAVEPPICGEGAFEKVDKTTCQLLVPEESINKYKTTDQWKEFLNILGYDGVDDVSVDTPDALYEVYNLQGVRVANPANGLYIRVQGKKATKVLVR